MLDASKMKLNNNTMMRGLSEFSATSILMIFSCIGCTANQQDYNHGILIASLIQGMAVVMIMHIFGFISGAHANPCVSIACCLLGHIGSHMMIFYVASQLAGATFGYFLLHQMVPQATIMSSKLGNCIVEPMEGLSYVQILSIEGFLAAVMTFAWCALWDVRSGRFLDSVTLRIGCLITACHLVGAQLTGATMNPAKLLIPTLYNGNPETVLMQLSGQLVACIIVPQIWHFVFSQRYRPLRVENSERPSPELYLTP
ncbi:aquaporin-2 [Drosophila albomicans]|uniref:Aquaporin-2 n=1 Tax=Drosophila albomicans TaxID=7291 RepID=A0A6P8WMM7_DROAB|nr:aquaporin-2 [Drosophila albomicans]